MSKSNVFRALNDLFSVTPKTPKTQKTPISITKPIKLPPKPTSNSPESTLNSKVKELLREKNSEVLVERFKHLSQFSYFRTRCRDIYKLTIHRLAMAEKYPLIEEVLESQKIYFSDEGFASRIIHLYGKYGMFDHAHKVFDELPERNCTPGVKCFNILLGAAANSGKYDKVYELFRELPVKLSIKPNVDCYNTAMHALCKLNLVEKAWSLLDEMEADGLQPSVVSFNTLLCVKYENGELEEGDKLWERMIESNVVPNVQSYNFKLQGLVNVGKLGEALELATELISKGVKPHACTFNAVIEASVKDDDLDCAKKWYGDMLKSGCAPNKATFSTLVPFLCEKGDYGLAFEVCEKMCKGRHCPMDEATLQKVVDGLAENSMTDKAKVLVELGMSSSYAPYNLVMPDTV